MRKIAAAAGFASRQSPSLSTIRIPSSTFWKIDENSQSVLRKAQSVSRCSLRSCENDQMLRNIAKDKATSSEGTRPFERSAHWSHAKRDKNRNPREATRVDIEHQRSNAGEGW